MKSILLLLLSCLVGCTQPSVTAGKHSKFYGDEANTRMISSAPVDATFDTPNEMVPPIQVEPLLRAKSRKVIDVTAEQLLKTPKKYSGRIVRVAGYWIRGFEVSIFSATEGVTTPDIWFEASPLPINEQHIVELRESIDQAYAKAGIKRTSGLTQFFITLEGLFEHRKSEDILDSFGHMGRFGSQLSMLKLIEIRVIPDWNKPPRSN